MRDVSPERYASQFWRKVTLRRAHQCWAWGGAHSEFGYGVVRQYGRNVLAHRVSWEMEHGEVLSGLQVLHKCDNPACINPHHLFLGTQKDNVQDMIAKGRRGSCRPAGELHGAARLKEAQVLAIRKDDRRYREIASEYGVSIPLISAIRTGRVWKHLPMETSNGQRRRG